MLRLALVMILVLSCGKLENGVNGERGLTGSDGLNYYSYLTRVNIQKIVGDDTPAEALIEESTIYQLPSSIDVVVDNSYPECRLKDFQLVVRSMAGEEVFTFQATEDRYKMKLKDGPVNKIIDSPYLKVYYKSLPEVDCGEVVYRLHSGVTFDVRVFKEIKVEK